MPDPIVILQYDPQWAEQFKSERELLLSALNDIQSEILHVGSTSVVGLAAKPIIDIMILVESESDALRSITPVVRQGYTCLGEDEVAGRLYFYRRGEKPTHIHLYVRGNPDAERLYAFRNYLQAHPAAIAAYAALKQDLAGKYRHDTLAYTDAKSDFIRSIDALAQQEQGNC